MAPEACVDRRDYRIRITGVSPADTNAALEKCGALASMDSNPVKVRHFKESTIIHFYVKCDPMFVDLVAFAMLAALCPHINDGLEEAFEPEQLQAIAS